MPISFKGAHFPKDVILTCARWCTAYPLSTRNLEDMMLEGQVSIDHSTMHRWGIQYSPQLEAEFHRCKRFVWVSWRMDEICIYNRAGRGLESLVDVLMTG